MSRDVGTGELITVTADGEMPVGSITVKTDPRPTTLFTSMVPMEALAANLFNVQYVPDGGDATSLPATGFLGAIIGGVMAGLIAHWITGWKVPTWMRGLMPVLVIPLLTSIIAGVLMITVFGKPIGRLMERADGRPELHERQPARSCSA